MCVHMPLSLILPRSNRSIVNSCTSLPADYATPSDKLNNFEHFDHPSMYYNQSMSIAADLSWTIQGVPKNALSECCWSHSALAQSLFAGYPCVWRLSLLLRLSRIKRPQVMSTVKFSLIALFCLWFCSISTFFGTPCTSVGDSVLYHHVFIILTIFDQKHWLHYIRTVWKQHNTISDMHQALKLAQASFLPRTI